ncbi:MAG TPA: hypothetical protein VEB19_10385 [Gemmatimonadaceae bacterium]|nr:hypothetical protein [Gemmatimonadaceae bacterium]
MKRASMYTWGVIALATAASCFDITDPDLSVDCGAGAYFGWFRGRATGLVSDTLVGCAYFMIDPGTGRFSLVLTDGGPLSTTPRIQMVRGGIPGVPVTVGDELGQIAAAMFVGTRRFVVTGDLFTTGPEKQKSNEMSLSGKVNLSGVDSVGATLAVTGEFVGKCIANTGAFVPQDQLKPDIPPECRMPDAGFRAPTP